MSTYRKPEIRILLSVESSSLCRESRHLSDFCGCLFSSSPVPTPQEQSCVRNWTIVVLRPQYIKRGRSMAIFLPVLDLANKTHFSLGDEYLKAFLKILMYIYMYLTAVSRWEACSKNEARGQQQDTQIGTVKYAYSTGRTFSLEFKLRSFKNGKFPKNEWMNESFNDSCIYSWNSKKRIH